MTWPDLILLCEMTQLTVGPWKSLPLNSWKGEGAGSIGGRRQEEKKVTWSLTRLDKMARMSTLFCVVLLQFCAVLSAQKASETNASLPVVLWHGMGMYILLSLVLKTAPCIQLTKEWQPDLFHSVSWLDQHDQQINSPIVSGELILVFVYFLVNNRSAKLKPGGINQVEASWSHIFQTDVGEIFMEKSGYFPTWYVWNVWWRFWKLCTSGIRIRIDSRHSSGWSIKSTGGECAL